MLKILSTGTAFTKKAFDFWLLFVATVLPATAIFFMQGGKTRTMEDILTQNNSWIPVFYINSDFFKLLFIYIFCTSLYFAFLKYKENRLDVVLVFVFVGILFNPFIQFDLNSHLLNIITRFATAVFFGYFAHNEYKKLTFN